MQCMLCPSLFLSRQYRSLHSHALRRSSPCRDLRRLLGADRCSDPMVDSFWECTGSTCESLIAVADVMARARTVVSCGSPSPCVRLCSRPSSPLCSTRRGCTRRSAELCSSWVGFNSPWRCTCVGFATPRRCNNPWRRLASSDVPPTPPSCLRSAGRKKLSWYLFRSSIQVAISLNRWASSSFARPTFSSHRSTSWMHRSVSFSVT